MNKDQYDSLNERDKALVAQGYVDGYTAALECVATMVIRIGDPIVDNLFVSNRDVIASTLKHTVDLLRQSHES